MALRSIFVLTILLSLVLVSCRSPRPFNPVNNVIRRLCRKTIDYRFCVSTIQSDPRSTTANLKVYMQILNERMLFKVDETYAYIEKLFYIQEDFVVKEYLALCLDEYFKASKKLQQIKGNLEGAHNYRRVRQLMRKVATHAASCQESFDRKKRATGALNHMPPKPCPITQQNQSVQRMAKVAAGLLA